MPAFPGTIDISGLGGNGFIIRGAGPYDNAGRSVASAGDINGDGYDDIIVGAPETYGAAPNPGMAYVVFGKAGGFATIDLGALAPTDGFAIEGKSDGNRLGRSVASAGDINGDGYDDIILGAPRAGGVGAGGEAYVIFGKSGGFTDIDLASLAPADGFVIEGNLAFDYAGLSVASAGDINGDGYDDMVVGAPHTLFGSATGQAYVIFGKAGGFANIDLGALAPADGFIIQGDAAGDHAGCSVSSAGDVNGDGYDDLIVGARQGDDGGADAGEAYVIFGKSAGFANIDLTTLAPADGFIIQGDAAGDRAGFSVASAGDINGDGFGDLIVGAVDGDDGGTDAGEAYVIFGKAGGFTNIDLSSLAAPDGFVIRGDTAFDWAGYSVAGAGDVNGDGYDDLIVGAANGESPGSINDGEAYVLYGKAGGFANIDLTALAAADGFRIVGDRPHDQLGTSVAAAGDVNGDGFDDIIVGAPQADSTVYGIDTIGQAYVIFGRGLAGLAGDLSTYTEDGPAVLLDDSSGPEVAAFLSETQANLNGGSVTVSVTANGLAAEDVLGISTAGTVTLSSGTSVGSIVSVGGLAIGTIAADGAGGDALVIDLDTADATPARVTELIRALTYSNANSNSPSELQRSVAVTVHDGQNGAVTRTVFVDVIRLNDPRIVDLSALGEDGFSIQGDAFGDFAGSSVSSAGDINDDGYDDIIIGAHFGELVPGSNHGEAYVLFGKAGGFTDIDLTSLAPADGFVVRGAASNDNLGFSVSSAGDVDGDGFDDIIVGARYAKDGADDVGSAYVIFGNSAGFADIDVAALAPADGFAILGDSDDDWTGWSVSSAGDINGDGYDDMIVGAPQGDNGGVNAGQAYVLFGKARIDLGDIDLGALAPADGFVIQGEGASDKAGWSVSSAGDINDDGYDDIMVASPFVGGFTRGATYVIFGKADPFANLDLSALAPADGFVIRGAALGDQAGYSVSSAGDVNGDGLDDLIIGALLAPHGTLPGPGTAYVVFGKTSGFGTIDLGALTSSDGFAMTGEPGNFSTGTSVSGAGDVNGDGFDDILVSAEYDDVAGTDAGKALVIFGKGSGFSNIDLSAITASDGFVIQGAGPGDHAGHSVSSAGDINGDGFDDILVGAFRNGDGGTNAGKAYVIFGRGISGLGGDETTYIEESAPVLLDNSSAPAAAAIFSDLQADMDGATLTVAITARLVAAEDVLGISTAGTITLSSGTDIGSIVSVGGLAIGTITSDGSGGDALVIALDTSDATPERITELIRSLTYLNVNFANPSTLRRTVEVSIDDGLDGGRVAHTIRVNVIDASDAPTLQEGTLSATFVEDLVNANPQLLDDDVAFSHIDNDFDTGTLTVSGLLAEDRVAIRNEGIDPGEIGVSGTDVSFGGTVIGTFTGGVGSTLTVTFNAGATFVAIDALIEHLTYANVSDTPTADRTLTLTVTDGDGENAYARGQTATWLALTGPANPFDGLNLGPDAAPCFIDLDGDGALDLVAGNGSGTLRSFLNNGDGTYTELIGAANPFDGETFGNSRPAAVLLDEDANEDLVVGGANGELSVYQNNGDGSFTQLNGAANPFDTMDFGDDATPAFGDVDGDGDLDGVIGSGAGNLFVLGNNGDGSFTLLAGAANPFDGVDVGADAHPAFIDFDDDGDMDLAVGDSTGAVHAFRNEGGGSFTELTGANNPLAGLGVGGMAFPGFVDLDGDDYLDAVIGADDGSLSAFRNTTPRALPILVHVTASDDLAVAQDDAFDTDEATAIAGSLFADNGSGVDVDVDGPFTVATVNGAAGNVGLQIMLASGALLTVQSNGSFSYDPNDAYDDTPTPGSGASNTPAPDSFSYTLTNGNGATVAISIDGLDSNDLLLGTAGTDALAGGNGNDIYLVENGLDSVTELGSQGTDTVRASVSYALGAGQSIELLTTTNALGTGAINLTGNGLNNSLTGNAGANMLDGGAGADNMTGGDASDTYIVDNTGDAVGETNALAAGGNDLVLSSVTYSLSNHVERLTLTGSANLNGTGNALNNSLTGNSGNNLLNGGLGADAMAGGLGDDIYVVDQAGDVVTELTGQGNDSVQSAVTFTLAVTIENLALTGSADINGTGNVFANILTGNSGANILNGGAGADTMNGGLGNDTYIVDNSSDVVLETSASGGTDEVQSSATFILGSNIERLILTGANAINGTGNNLANVLTGNNAANILDGGFGADTMQGNGGNDTYIIDNAGDVIVELVGGGTDTVQTSLNHTLAADFENLTLTGTGNLNGTGNGAVNVLTGNSGANQLDGGGGGDTMVGGLGNDSYFIDSGLDIVIEAAGSGIDTINSAISHDLENEVENLVLTGVAAINGTGNGLANTLTGNGAANRLDGGAGADVMKGGLGDDTYIVDNLGDVVSDLAGQGTDLVKSSVSFTLGAATENLTLTGTDNVDATGNLFANVLNGNNGNNTLDGKAGADTMNGGLGNDNYVVDNAGDVVFETSAVGGTDGVQSAVTYTLSSNIENLTLTGASAINGTGNGLVNVMTGNAQANVLNGLGGNDELHGAGGNDHLHGGTGNDSLEGGLGNDGFYFESALTAGNVDTILDFTAANDTIFLDDAVFTGLAAGTLAAGAFQSGAVALDADDRILYDSATGQIRFDADGTGAAAAILFATVTAGTALTNADFVVY